MTATQSIPASFANYQTTDALPAKTFQAVLNEWERGDIDQKLLTELKKEPCFFEMPPLGKRKVTFHYTIIPTTFSGRADPSRFMDKLKNKKEPVTCFQSLSGSLLIVPTDTSKDYGHLQSFLLNADKEKEVKPFFKEWATSAKKALKNHEYVWLSTHGKGVPWLHGRIDFKPKYYHTEHFKSVR